MVIAPASDIDTNAVDPLGIPLHHDPKLAPRRRDATARFKLLTDQQQGTYLRREMHGISIEAFGDLVGTGVWTLTQDGPDADAGLRMARARRQAAPALRLMVLQGNLRGEPSLGHGTRRRKPEARARTAPRGITRSG